MTPALSKDFFTVASTKRQGEIKVRAFPGPGNTPGFPAVILNDMLDDRKPEPRPAEIARTGLVRAVKSLKNTSRSLFRDPHTGIMNPDPDFTHRALGVDDDRAFLTVKFYGIINEVDEDLFQLVRVRRHRHIRHAIVRTD